MIALKLSKPAADTAAKLLQSCPTLCDPIDGSPPGSAILGILQARILEWVAISFSNSEYRHGLLLFFKLINLLFLAVLGLCCFSHGLSQFAASRGYSLVAFRGLPPVEASVVFKHGLQAHTWGPVVAMKGLSNCGT